LGDRGGLLARAAASASAAGHPLFIVDDGSPDDSVSTVAERYGARLVRRASNGGVAAAQNTGLDAVCTPWVRFLHSDDLLVPMQNPSVLADPVDALQSATAYGPGWVPTADELLLHKVGTHIGHYVMRTDSVRSLRFDERLRSWEDWDLIYRMSRSGMSVEPIDERLVELGHGASDRLSGSSAMLDGIVYLYAKHNDALRRHRRARSAWEFKVARGVARSGDRSGALAWLARSLWTEPWHPRRALHVIRLAARR